MLMFLRPAAGGGLEADDDVGDVARLGRGCTRRGFAVERHAACRMRRCLRRLGGSGFAGLALGGEGGAVGLLLLLRSA